jgi:hypothetical protein
MRCENQITAACPFFEPKVLIEKHGSGAAPPKVVDSHRQDFLDLFKK